MAKKQAGYIEKFLKKADKAVDDGIKRADEVLDDAVEFGVMAAGQAKKASADIQERAKKERANIRSRGAQLGESITAARRSASAENDLATLEKLGKLQKSGIITKKEFDEKKKKILARI